MRQEFGFSQAALGGMFWVYLVSAGFVGWWLGFIGWIWVAYALDCAYIAYFFVKVTNEIALPYWKPKSPDLEVRTT